MANYDDVDLWVYGPGEAHPVGYSDKNGIHMDLVRDDIPELYDHAPAHFENVISRGIWPGEYVINAHLYAGITYPVQVTIMVDINMPDEKATRHLLQRTATLLGPGDEITVLRFFLMKNGTIEPGSVNHVFQPLRSAG